MDWVGLKEFYSASTIVAPPPYTGYTERRLGGLHIYLSVM